MAEQRILDAERAAPELAPCPFCGGAAEISKTPNMWMVECNNAGCGSNPDALAAFKHDVIAAWNRRAPVSTPQQSAQHASVDTPECSQQMLEAAMKAAVANGLVPKYVDEEAYLRHWNGMKACINAALGVAHINAWGSAGSGVPADPLDWPIPCDITTGACTIRKGCKLRTVVTRMESLQRMATAALPKLSPEERQANWEALKALAAPSPAPQGDQA